MMTKTIALVTGANKGIGFATVRALAQRDMTVLLGARDPERRDRVTNAVLPLLMRSEAGRIINVSSGYGSVTQLIEADRQVPMPAQVDYPTSKAALNALTFQYAKELAAHGITVNAITPGFCATDFNSELGIAIARTAADGAAVIVEYATAGPDGPTGGFFDESGSVPW